MKNNFSIKNAFAFSLSFIKKNRFLMLMFIIAHLLINFVTSVSFGYNDIIVPAQENFYISFIYKIASISSLFSVRQFPYHFSLNINLFRLLITFAGYYLLIFLIFSIINWKDYCKINIKEQLLKTFQSTTILKIIAGFLLIGLIISSTVLLCILPVLIISSDFNNYTIVLLYIITIPLGIFIAIYLLTSYIFFPYILIEENTSVGQSIKESNSLSKGYKWQLIEYLLLFGLINVPFYLLIIFERSLIKLSLVSYIFEIIFYSLVLTVLNTFLISSNFHIFRQIREFKGNKK